MKSTRAYMVILFSWIKTFFRYIHKGSAFRKGYNSVAIGSLGPIQTYPNNPYCHRKDLQKFCDWHYGVGIALADLIIADCYGRIS